MIDFTVVMCVYNTPAKDLLESVTSILNQSYKSDWKLTLVNDGSTNADTLRMLKFLKEYDKVSVMNLPKNIGEPAALNVFHNSTDIEWIAKCDSDDVFHIDKFKIQIEWLENNPDVSVLGHNLWAFDNKDIERKRIFETKHKLEAHPNNNDWWFVNHGSVFYKNQAVKDSGGYTEGKTFAYDLDLWERMYNNGFKIQCLPECLYAWRRYI